MRSSSQMQIIMRQEIGLFLSSFSVYFAELFNILQNVFIALRISLINAE